MILLDKFFIIASSWSPVAICLQIHVEPSGSAGEYLLPVIAADRWNRSSNWARSAHRPSPAALPTADDNTRRGWKPQAGTEKLSIVGGKAGRGGESVPHPLNRNFHFAFPATDQYAPSCLRRVRFFASVSIPKARADWKGPPPGQKVGYCFVFKRFLGHLSLNSPPSSRLVSPGCRAYPAGSSKARIRRSMLPNRRRVRWLSANNSQ